MESNVCSDVVHLPPKPPLPRIPSNAHAPRDHVDKVAVSPRQNRERKVKVKTSKRLPSDCSEDMTTADPDHPPLESRKPSGVRPNVDFSVLRQIRKSESSDAASDRKKSDGETMTSPNATNTKGSDVIYDEPFAEFETRSLKSMIKSDGYIRLSADVIEATELLRKRSARLHRKSCLRGGPGEEDLSKTTAVLPRSRSTDSLDILLDFAGCPSFLTAGGKTLRSSFVDPNGPPTRRSVYLDLGDYQTLLKHSRNDDERVYSLPQPQCYGEETLRAVRRITQKYDTVKRRQLRDLSFRDGAGIARRSRDEGRSMGRAAAAGPSGESSPSAPGAEAVVDAAESAAVERRSAEPEVDGAAPEVGGSRSKGPEENGTSSSQSLKSDWSSLRDYCNCLEETEDADDDVIVEGGGGLSRSGLIRIELFYRSRESVVRAARCLADLFVGSGAPDSSSSSVPMVHQHTGVPVWVLNSGLGIRRRELLLVLAERETGLPLWQDRISYLSEYHAPSPEVHCLRVSGSLRKTVQLRMSCRRSGEEFLATFRQMASDPNDDLWKVGADNRKSTKKTGSGGGGKKRQRLSKLSISQPCNFVRVSCVDLSDENFRAAFSGIVPLAIKKSTTVTAAEDFGTASDTVQPGNAYGVADGTQCEFRPRLPTR